MRRAVGLAVLGDARRWAAARPAAARQPAGSRAASCAGRSCPSAASSVPCEEPARGVKLVFSRSGKVVARTTTNQKGYYRDRAQVRPATPCGRTARAYEKVPVTVARHRAQRPLQARRLPHRHRHPLADNEVDELPGDDDLLADLLAVQELLNPRRGLRLRDSSSSTHPAETSTRSRTRPFTWITSSNVSRSSSAGSASGHGCSHSRSCPSRDQSSSAMCGAYGWISVTAVSAAKRAAGSSGARPSSLTSSITAAIGVLNWKRRSMSSVTRAIVRCAVRARSVGADSPSGALLGDLAHDAPQPLQEARDPLDALLRPLHVLIGRAHEEDVQPHRVCAVHVRQLRRGRSRSPSTSTSSSRPGAPSPGGRAAGTARGRRRARARSAPS